MTSVAALLCAVDVALTRRQLLVFDFRQLRHALVYSTRLVLVFCFRRKLEVYREKLLPKHPPIFNEWFLRTFADPTSWYNARVAYCRTAAVMSMTGYILGLGDRHGENILLDSTSGHCVHVDFNCLFNKVSHAASRPPLVLLMRSSACSVEYGAHLTCMALLVYDCQGETFEFPEVVPFRLTHNMVDAMGPMGYEGLFRRACEVCMRVMRNQSDPLMRLA